MIYKTYSYWIWVVFFIVLACLLTNVPLFNLLAFEFCAVITICISFIGAHVAMTELQVMRNQPDLLSGTSSQFVFRSIFRAFRSNAILLFFPLIIILINSFRVKNCNFVDGLLFYLLLPVLSCVAVTAAGVFFALLLKKRWIAFIAYIATLILSCIPTLINLIFHPPVFAYHPILGYFPGPIYDSVIQITSAFIFSRTETLILAALFTSISVITCEVGRETGFIPKLRLRNLNCFSTRRSSMALCVMYSLIVCLIFVEVFSGKLGIRPSRSEIEKTLGGYRETSHFEIYYSQELEDEIQLFSDDCEFQYSQVSRYFQSDISRKVKAYLYSTPEQKKKLIGAGNTYVEDPFGYGFHIHAQGFPHPVLKHELAHVFTADWSPWRVSLNVGIHEGIAVAADWNEGKLTVHQWAKAMRELNVAPPLSSVMGLGFWRHAGSRSYLLAGSFVRFLVDRYGIEKFIKVFPLGNLSKAYMKDFDELEQEWIGFLTTEVSLQEYDYTYAQRRLKRGGIFEQVCAHEMASLSHEAWQAYYSKHFKKALTTFEQMLTHEPNNPLTLRGLMYSAFQSRDFELAKTYANRIIAAENSFYKAESALLIGDIYWLENIPEKAQASYTLATTFAPRESIELRLIKKLEALKDTYAKESQFKLRSVLISNNPFHRTENATAMELLQQVIEAEPNGWLVYFLGGEMLHKERAWEFSSKYLEKVDDLNSKSENEKTPSQILLKTNWLLATNSFYMNDYRSATNTFLEIANDDSQHLGTRLVAQYWVERCKWSMRKQKE